MSDGDGGGVILGGVGSLSMKRFGLNPNPNLDPSMVNEECLVAAEEAAKEVLKCIHPTLDSDEKRNDVIEYIQSLMSAYLGCQVFPYGSVPLKTYLPDGDIDLTAIHAPFSDEYLPKAVFAVLREEELNGNGEYEVKDIQFIDAEVKLVKCIVQNISIDISFNQLGGLCTLCFIEQVDRLVGNDHLFKRSILLVKTWCYFESRILGSHHGLISTYALETMVLYIFHLFHSSLSGPLAVLYRFLDYYSKFDWNKFCISLNGPVSKTSLPDIVVDKPDNEGNKLLLSEDFLRDCMDMFSVSSSDDALKTFPPKYLDIIDPLKEFNNLGRSVHRGNFYRIQCAFRYGAFKLGQILSLPRDRMTDEIKTFFTNTLERYPCKNGCFLPKRIDAEGYIDFFVFPSDDLVFQDEMLLRSSLSDFEDDSKGMEEKYTAVFGEKPGKYSKSMVSSQALSESSSANGFAGSENFIGDGYGDLSCFTSQLGDVTSDCFNNKICQCKSVSCTENRDLQFGISSQNNMANESSEDKHEMIDGKPSATSSTKTDTLENFSLDSWLKDLSNIKIDVEPLDPPSDLTGDYDSHLRNLLYGQGCLGVASSAQLVTYPHLSSSPSQFLGESPWDAVQPSIPLQWDSYPQHNSNIGYVESYNDFATDSASSICLSNEDKSVSRGTCAYFPNTNFRGREEALKGGRARNKIPRGYKLPRDTSKKSESSSPPERSFAGSYEDHQWPPLHRKSAVAQTHVSKISSASCGIQFGTMSTLPTIPSGSSQNLGPGTNVLHKLRRSKSENKEHERVIEHSFHLKNEEFPALHITNDIGKKSAFHLKNEEEFPALPITTDIGKKSAVHLKNEEEFPALPVTTDIGKKSAFQFKNEEEFPALCITNGIGKKSACRG